MEEEAAVMVAEAVGVGREASAAETGAMEVAWGHGGVWADAAVVAAAVPVEEVLEEAVMATEAGWEEAGLCTRRDLPGRICHRRRWHRDDMS